MKRGDLLLHLEAFLALENALGSPVRARERLLRDFVGFIEALGIDGPITAQVAFDWACAASERRGISGQAARLSVVRRFLLHLSVAIPATEVPCAALVARPSRAAWYSSSFWFRSILMQSLNGRSSSVAGGAIPLPFKWRIRLIRALAISSLRLSSRRYSVQWGPELGSLFGAYKNEKRGIRLNASPAYTLRFSD